MQVRFRQLDCGRGRQDRSPGQAIALSIDSQRIIAAKRKVAIILRRNGKWLHNRCVQTTESKPDEIDEKIVAILKRNAKSTLSEIGHQVGLSAPAVKRRIDRLEASKVILGYTVVVDHAKLGRPIEAFAELRFSGTARVDDIAGIADGIDEVEAVFTMAGDPDALAWIRVRDVNDLKRVIDRIRNSGRVIGTKTLMVLGRSTEPASPKDGRG
jgi:Lrp/AsnC family transcriptional regulator, leucine-responsive regulatory protein